MLSTASDVLLTGCEKYSLLLTSLFVSPVTKNTSMILRDPLETNHTVGGGKNDNRLPLMPHEMIIKLFNFRYIFFLLSYLI